MTGDEYSTVVALADAQRGVHVVVAAWAARSPVSPAFLYTFEARQELRDLGTCVRQGVTCLFIIRLTLRAELLMDVRASSLNGMFLSRR